MKKRKSQQTKKFNQTNQDRKRSFLAEFVGYSIDLNDERHQKYSERILDITMESIISLPDSQMYGDVSLKFLSIEFERDMYLLFINSRIDEYTLEKALTLLQNIQPLINQVSLKSFDETFKIFLNNESSISESKSIEIRNRVEIKNDTLYLNVPIYPPYLVGPECS